MPYLSREHLTKALMILSDLGSRGKRFRLCGLAQPVRQIGASVAHFTSGLFTDNPEADRQLEPSPETGKPRMQRLVPVTDA